MHFDDLSEYTYGERPKSCTGALAVGWLALSAPFVMGAISRAVMSRVKVLVENPINLTRGYHACEFCVDHLRNHKVDSRALVRQLRDLGALGNGEILVTGLDGVCYFSPVLVAHYMEVHEYCPPLEYCEAVVSMHLDAAVRPDERR
ncbi:hypothetical protein Rhe02_35690 [Rhizocola hellebori]|uniref:DUF7919 domain-containing protein n=1 Tax=Rhizocola hellebori TaxID=1392758 RepID=A0A8J3VGT4_9ACTN|nr:hypothetical protein Rhe02_35690 [Rhizocola hellebori]